MRGCALEDVRRQTQEHLDTALGGIGQLCDHLSKGEMTIY
jgi:hypothetical protein